MSPANLLLMSIPALVALAGGILAAFWHPSRNARSLIQHFAAGVVLAALAVELLPEISREHAPGPVLAGCFALPVPSLLEGPIECYRSRARAIVDASAAIPAFLRM